ncbi:cutinase transcription factor 1 alpha [Stemphylium lycopersici]|uniref:Cutinase transcription factor 1 alpha n=1 Tax=Stemphylium lycopersici TaxID=183478 RepID=A0A364NE30_STELY|nr:cutinase transcription factor 1 alpha [Stemphylium lycopersici]RAR15351.1 cutinase transcription factor 1 alpha [Stemphylium lycopersici]
MSEPPRKRAKLACVTCNARRVKCDVTDRQPCGNCIAGSVQCETRESKRGKHIRKPRAGTEARSKTPPSVPALSPQRHEDEVAASHVLASLSSNFHSPVNTHTPSTGSQYQFSAPSVPPESYNDHTRHESTQQEDAVFLGESSSLRYVTGEPTAAAAERRESCFRHAVPKGVRAEAHVPEWEAERRIARKKALQAEGAFSFPPAAVRQELLEAYFKWFHPHFAIIDEEEFWNSYCQFDFSGLLLQAMMFIGVIHCEESTLNKLAWGNRHRAKWFFYIRAKDIYDATYETDKIIVVQALFLMSFWRAGALLEKDARHWLGTAISLSETRALHRSGGNTEEKLTRVKRRLWWAIYVRERQCAAALGLPCRIRDKDCDIEPLSYADFTSAFQTSAPAEDRHRSTTYAISMVQLAVFLGRVVDAGYLPGRTLTPEDTTKLRDELYQWKKDLPAAMQLHTDAGDLPNFQASMLHLAYNNLLILLHRTSFIMDENRGAATEGNVALQAAARNSRIVEDMLPDGNIGHAQMHVITNLFNTLCIHVVNFRRSSGINRTLAEHRAKLCLLGLQELQKTWEVTNWVLQLFFHYLDRDTASRLTMEADDVGNPNIATQPSNVYTSPAHQVSLQQSADGTASRNALQTGIATPSTTSPKPWSWTLDEADQYLFTQIENDFAFGEGGLRQLCPDDMLSNAAPADFVYH